MKKTFSIGILVLMLATMLFGCGKSSSLEGKWVNSVAGVEMYAFEFTDKTVTYTIAGQDASAVTLNYTAEDGKLVCTNDNGAEIVNCEYTLDGDTLTMDWLGTGSALTCTREK